MDDSFVMLMDRLGEIAYYTAKGAGFKAHKPKGIDITVKSREKQLKGFDSGAELDEAIKRIRGSA